MNNTTLTICLVAMAALAAPSAALAQRETTNILRWSELNGLEYQLHCGLNIGGTAPIPLPREIREINGYNPKLNLIIGGDIIKWFGCERLWGASVGLRLENQAMATKSTVKDYSTEVVKEGARMAGRWNGKVNTRYHATLVTFSLNGRWRPNPNWTFNFGPFLALSVDHEFTGHVHDGYLREGNPTGNIVIFDTDPETGKKATATYEFDDDLRTLHYGLEGGAQWYALKHFFLRANLSWAFNNVFKSDFETVTFTLHPIYLNIGFGYRF